MYFVTTLGYGGTRCVGYFENFSNAEDILLNNVCDVYENGYYEYAVIEFVKPGLYNHDLSPSWYTWNDDIKGYTKSSMPEQYKQLCGFCFG